MAADPASAGHCRPSAASSFLSAVKKAARECVGRSGLNVLYELTPTLLDNPALIFPLEYRPHLLVYNFLATLFM